MMYVEQWDRVMVLSKLSALSDSTMIRFACGCAELVLPIYRYYCRDESWYSLLKLRNDVDLAWIACESPGTVDLKLTESIAHLGEIIPDEDTPNWTFRVGVAESVLSAVLYTLKVAMEHDADDAWWITCHVLAAVDLLELQAVPSNSYDKGESGSRATDFASSCMHQALEESFLQSSRIVAERYRKQGENLLKLCQGYVHT